MNQVDIYSHDSPIIQHVKEMLLDKGYTTSFHAIRSLDEINTDVVFDTHIVVFEDTGNDMAIEQLLRAKNKITPCKTLIFAQSAPASRIVTAIKHGATNYITLDEYPGKEAETLINKIISATESNITQDKNLKGCIQKYSSILQSLHDPIFIIKEDFEIIFANYAFTVRFGKLDEKKDTYFEKIFGSNHKDAWYKRDNRKKESALRCQQIINNRIYQISEKNINLDNNDCYTMIVMRDITKLVKARKKAEESNRLKSVFLANISHEVRTPLNAILGLTSLMMEVSVSQEDQAEYIKLINEGGQNLLKVIDDIMEFSLLDSGLVKLSIEEFHVDRIAQTMQREIKTIQEMVKTPNIKVVLQNEVTDTVIVKSDFQKIKKIYIHLLRNAFKFTKAGKIRTRISTDKTGLLHIEVSDTGIGIPKDKQRVIFSRFRQLDERRTRQFGGNGLGLALTKHLTQMLGGKIDLESEPGKGSTFKISIPVRINYKN